LGALFSPFNEASTGIYDLPVKVLLSLLAGAEDVVPVVEPQKRLQDLVLAMPEVVMSPAGEVSRSHGAVSAIAGHDGERRHLAVFAAAVEAA
jgi:hypothetical protein